MTWVITVRGVPRPQGSAKAFVIPAKDGRKPRAVVTSDTKDLDVWRQAVAEEARRVIGDQPMLAGEVRVDVSFTLKRPQSHWSSKGEVKPSAPARPTTRPDVDKLARAILDALTGVCFSDDSQVVGLRADKWYQAVPDQATGVTVVVEGSE